LFETLQNIPPYIDDLIAKHLAHETSLDEMRALDSWIREDAANRLYYESMESLLLEQKSDGFEDFTSHDWNLVKSRMQKNTSRKYFIPLSLGAAALLILGIASYLLFLNPSQKKILTAAYIIQTGNEIHTDTLADGTVVTLNRNSMLKVAEGFSQNNRTAELKGEGYFEIKPGNPYQFTIVTDQGSITDIGTRFLVNARSKDQLEIQVTEGEVQLLTRSNQKVNATAGHALSYDAISGEHTVTAISENAIAFKTHSFHFQNRMLKDIVAELNEVYGNDITYDAALATCPVTVAFENEKIETILDIIAETLNIKYRKLEGGYHLAGNRCN
jgi:transmembrane sensor